MFKKNIFSSLKMQFVLILMGTILPFFMLSIYNITHMTRLEARNTELNAQEQAYIAARDFENTIQNTRHILFNISEDPRIIQDRDYCQNYTEGIPYRETSITNILAIKTDGTLLCSSVPINIPDDIQKTIWFEKIIYGQSQTIVPMDSFWEKGKLFTTVTTAHYTNIGLTDGIIVALINQDWIKSVRGRIDLPENSTISLSSPSGLVLYREKALSLARDRMAWNAFTDFLGLIRFMAAIMFW
jgi:hypothetical protein